MRKINLLLSFAAALAGLPVAASVGASGSTERAEPRKADAYYHFALGHLYAELASSYGNKGDFLNLAIENYREALRADPEASFIADELSDLYIQAGRLREAIEEAKANLEKDPKDANSRRILGRIYTRLLGDPRQGRINEEMVKRAIEQYQKLAELTPKDTEIWLTLGRLYKLAQNSVEAEHAYKKVLELEADQEEALIGLAMVYSDLGDQPRAAEMLRRVVAKNPTVRTLTALARSYEQQRDFKQAAETFRRALELAPDNEELRYGLAENLLMIDQVEEALKTFEELAEQDPRDYRPLLRISQIYRQKGRFEQARQALNKAKASAPENLEVLYHEVNLLESEGKTEEAIKALKDIVDSTRKSAYSAAERSNRAVLLERLGSMHRAHGQYEQAVAVFAELKGLSKEVETRAAAQIADTYRQAKQFRKAAEEIEPVYRSNPEDRMVAVVRATVLADLGKADDAINTIKKLRKANKTPSLDDLLVLAQIYEKTKRYDEMGKATEEALRLARTDEEKAAVLFMRGAMFERKKQYEQAEAAFREVLRLDPDNASAMNYLGYMFADRNVRLEEAYQLIRKALEQDPHNGAYLDSLGWVYYRMGKLEEAEEYLRRAVEKAGRDPIVHDHLADVYFKQGRLKEAIAHWRISLKEWEASAAGEKDPVQMAEVQRKLEGAEVRLAKESALTETKQR
jgi:tetratricopeptide (TPR) repeat protein